MRITVSAEKILTIFISGAVLCGCLAPDSSRMSGLEHTRYAVRKQMLKLQRDELLAKSANEHYAPHSAAEILTLANDYQEQMWRIDNDPALQILEDAISYAVVVLAQDPSAAAKKLSAAMLDYGTAVRMLNLKYGRGGSALDLVAELAMMTGWDSDKVRKYAAAPLPEVKVEIFPIYAEAERMLKEKGNSSAFQVAAELYRIPSGALLRKAEQLRRAMLNRYLMQTKSPEAKMTPELRIAHWRGQLFVPFIPSI